MKVNPIISATISRAPTSVYDHVLAILPTASGSSKFESVSDYKTFLHLFGKDYSLPGKTQAENEDYSALLLNSLKYILDNGIPLLCTNVKTAVNSAIRIYYLEQEAQPWYVCSIAHKGLPEGLEGLPEAISDFFNSGVIKGTSVSHTLVHSLPLNRRKNELGEWERIEADGNARFITLPMIDTEHPNNVIIPYLLMLEDNSLEDTDRNNDLYPNTSPIQEEDSYGHKHSVIMTCHGTDDEIMDEVTRINGILENLNSVNESSYTKWKCIFDQERNRLLFISNHYVYSSAMYSVYNGEDFVPDTNLSGVLLDEYTKPYAVIDIKSKLSGDVGNEFRVEFKKTQKGTYIWVYQLANCIEQLKLYESDEDWEYLVDSEFIKVKQYSQELNPMSVFTDNYFKGNRIELFGGYDDETFSYQDIAKRIDDFFEDQDECPIDLIYDCMCENLSFHEYILQHYTNFENQNVTLLTCGTLDSNSIGVNPYIDRHKFVFYDTRPIRTFDYDSLSLGAVIAVNLHRFNYLPNIQAILDEKYLQSIQLRQGERVITPEIDHNIVYLNELKIAGLDLEDSIDRFISSFVYNEFQELFMDNLVGDLPTDDYECFEKCEELLTYMSTAPELIQSYSITDFERSEGTLNLTIQINREEISGGTRNLYININL